MNEECAIADVLDLLEVKPTASPDAIPQHVTLYVRRRSSRIAANKAGATFERAYTASLGALTPSAITAAAAKANVPMEVLCGSPRPVGTIGDGHIIAWIKAEVAKLEAWGAAHPEFLEFLEALAALIIPLLLI